MAKNEPQSFEITEYSKDAERLDVRIGAIKEIVDSIKKKSPNLGVQVAFTGNLMKLTFHCYEMHLPVRMKEVEGTAKDVLNEAIKIIKKEFKEKLGETLTPKEKKEMANYSTQKVSLNERYVYSCWRFYEI